MVCRAEFLERNDKVSQPHIIRRRLRNSSRLCFTKISKYSCVYKLRLHYTHFVVLDLKSTLEIAFKLST